MICSSLDAQLPYSTLSPGDGTKSLPLSSNMAACRQFTSKERVGDNDAGEIPDADICLASGKDDADVDCAYVSRRHSWVDQLLVFKHFC